MKPYSLRLRLLLWASLWITLALVVAGMAIGWLFTVNVEAQVRRDLGATFNRLTALIDPAAMPPALAGSLADPRYETPLSGLYWQIVDNDTGQLGRSRSLWDFELALPADDPPTDRSLFEVIDGPTDSALTALFRLVHFETGTGTRTLTVVVAEDRAVLAASIDRFGRDLALALLMVGIGLSAAAWLQVHLGLRPLQALRRAVENVRQGETHVLEGAYPEEVTALVAEVNDLLRSQETSIEFARARAADLAHGLKTPLSVLSSTAEELRSHGEGKTATLIEEMTRDMSDRIDYQLRLTRLQQRTRSLQLKASLNDALEKTVLVLRRTQQGERLDWQLTVAPDLLVDLDQHDLVELIGVILENAANWAKSAVLVHVEQEGADAVIDIEDDGPGLEDSEIEAASRRGGRLDQSASGSGLGLAIAAEIVSMNRGRMEFSRASLGGLKVRLVLPLANPARLNSSAG